eukprot:TRINITY_DN80018_c0_g1_i3.p1 TRINITY_DN80018_c0_g1~~TRINITY_DN80018_c0_g1_i3.p1  ORF type:complete len:617 (-),score=80.63 TRINITY_DN80018_c0_g1_i3:151-2001(-)
MSKTVAVMQDEAPLPVAVTKGKPKLVIWEERESEGGASSCLYSPVLKERILLEGSTANGRQLDGELDLVVDPNRDPAEFAGEIASYESIGQSRWIRVLTDMAVEYFRHRDSSKWRYDCPEEILEEVRELDELLGTLVEDDEVFAEEEEELDDFSENDNVSSSSSISIDRERQALIEQMKTVESFKDSLKELIFDKRGFIPYEKAHPQLMFDGRFTMLPVTQRGPLYEKTLKELKNAKRAESSKSAKEAKDRLRELFVEAQKDGNLHASTKIDLFSLEYSDDPRWTDPMVATARVPLLSAEISVFAEGKRKKEADAVTDFEALVREKLTQLEGGSRKRWDSFKRSIRDEERYKAVYSSSQKEKCFERIQRQISASKKRPAVLEPGGNTTMARDLKRLQLQREQRESEAYFKELLSNTIKEPWTLTEVAAEEIWANQRGDCKRLNRRRKLELFAQFTRESIAERQDSLRLALHRHGVNGELHCSSTFDQTMKTLGADTDRLFKTLPVDYRRQVYSCWQREKLKEDKESFMALLIRTSSIRAYSQEQGPGFECVKESLAAEISYKRLHAFTHIREELIRERIRNLREQCERHKSTDVSSSVLHQKDEGELNTVDLEEDD